MSLSDCARFAEWAANWFLGSVQGVLILSFTALNVFESKIPDGLPPFISTCLIPEMQRQFLPTRTSVLGLAQESLFFCHCLQTLELPPTGGKMQFQKFQIQILRRTLFS